MKALGKITGDCLLRAAALAVAGGLLLTGCVKEDAGSCGPGGGSDGEVALGFRPGALTVAGAYADRGGWNAGSAKGGVQAARPADAATRADVPPAPDSGPGVDDPDDLPAGTTFRVLVYEAGADPQSDSPVDQNTYKIADAEGTIVATAVDGKGNATEGDTREIVLRRGAYDFYYFSPAVPASTALPNPGTYAGLTNGADYMALVQRQEIDPSKGPEHYIPEVCFYRMGSYIDVRIGPREGEIMGSLAVTGDGLQLWGLSKSGRYEVGEYPYSLTVEGSGGVAAFSPARFANETVTTVSTVGRSGGLAVLPGYADGLTVKVTLTSDKKEMKLNASLPGYVFEPGYRYMVELGVGRIADNPELDVKILPWDEYAWGGGEIGGGFIRSRDVTPYGDIPWKGGPYHVTLTGYLPAAGVEVRANIGGADPVTGKVTASGTPVTLDIPANTTGAERTVTFEYLWNGTWTQIGDDRSQERLSVGSLYGGGVVYWVNPVDATDFRVVALDESSKAWAASENYVLGEGAQDETVRNGADVWKIAKDYSDKKTGGASGDFATDFPAFAYCYNYQGPDGSDPQGTWYLPSARELQDLYAAKGSVESVITANSGTPFSVNYDYWSTVEVSFATNRAGSVNFDNGAGNLHINFKETSCYVRCVRGK